MKSHKNGINGKFNTNFDIPTFRNKFNIWVWIDTYGFKSPTGFSHLCTIFAMSSVNIFNRLVYHLPFSGATLNVVSRKCIFFPLFILSIKFLWERTSHRVTIVPHTKRSYNVVVRCSVTTQQPGNILYKHSVDLDVNSRESSGHR